MRFTLLDIEKKLETFFEIKLQSLFNKNFLISLTNELIEEFNNGIRVINNTRIAPNIYKIIIQDKRHFCKDELIEWKIFAHQLIIELTQENSVKLSGPIYIEISFDTSIKTSFEVFISHSASTSGKTINLVTKTAPISDGNKLPSAFMILWNEDIYKLTKNITNIGRRENNDLIIDNLRVSRLHAQIRRKKDGFTLFDIDSTSGTKVNGYFIKQHQLSNGDVIEIADVPLIYSCERVFDKKYPRSTTTKIITTDIPGKEE
ncbi:MAG: FHA domain-containing protein [Anaerolineaceae bacterium]|nr:FHA domain-containing protein [Anaerolineaceae bacterium]